MDIVEILGRLMASLIIISIIWHLLDKPRLKAVEAAGDAAAVEKTLSLTRLFYAASIGSMAAQLAPAVLAGTLPGPAIAFLECSEAALFAVAAFFEFRLVRTTTPVLVSAKTFPSSMGFLAPCGKWKSALFLAAALIAAGSTVFANLAPSAVVALALTAKEMGLTVFASGLYGVFLAITVNLGLAYWIAVGRAAKAVK